MSYSVGFKINPAYRTQAVQNAAATRLSNARDLCFLVNFGVLQGDSNHSNLSLLTEIIQNDTLQPWVFSCSIGFGADQQLSGKFGIRRLAACHFKCP